MTVGWLLVIVLVGLVFVLVEGGYRLRKHESAEHLKALKEAREGARTNCGKCGHLCDAHAMTGELAEALSELVEATEFVLMLNPWLKMNHTLEIMDIKNKGRALCERYRAPDC